MLIMLWCVAKDRVIIVVSFTLALSSGLLASVSDDATVWIQSLNNRKKKCKLDPSKLCISPQDHTTKPFPTSVLNSS